MRYSKGCQWNYGCCVSKFGIHLDVSTSYVEREVDAMPDMGSRSGMVRAGWRVRRAKVLRVLPTVERRCFTVPTLVLFF